MVTDRWMDLAAAFGPVLKEAFPERSAIERMAVAEALSEAVKVRQSWFTPPEVGGELERVSVRKIETVTGDFLTDPGEPFWRIEIDGFCADFDHEQAANNFANAISARISPPEVGGELVERVKRVINDERDRWRCLTGGEGLHDLIVRDDDGGEPREVSRHPQGDGDIYFWDMVSEATARAVIATLSTPEVVDGKQVVRASAQEGTALSSQATEPQASPPCGLQSTAAWQPIDTAPKDRPILVWYDHDADPYRDPANPDVLTTYACHAEAGDFLDGKGITIARWCEAYEESNGWEAGDSWWMPAVWCAWFNNDNADQVCNPTHWMPLPEAPRS